MLAKQPCEVLPATADALLLLLTEALSGHRAVFGSELVATGSDTLKGVPSALIAPTPFRRKAPEYRSLRSKNLENNTNVRLDSMMIEACCKKRIHADRQPEELFHQIAWHALSAATL